MMTGFAIAGAIFVGTYFHAADEYTKSVETIYRDLSNYALLVSEHTANVTRGTDQLLLFLKNAVETGGDVEELLRFMARNIVVQKSINQIGVIDAQGLYVASNLKSHARIDLSDREHFKVHIPADTQGLYISKPVIGRASGKISIQLSRRLNNPDGSFAGVGVASINPRYFSQIYSRLDLGRQGTITIVGLDGIVRARRDMDRETAGQDIASARLFTLLPDSDASHYRTRSLIDGVDRFYAYRRLHGYPLVVLIGVGVDEALAEYQHGTRIHYLFAAGVSWLVLVFSLLILHLLSRQRLMLSRLQDSQALAEKANRAKNEFLAKVTHEIRTPLNAVKGLGDYVLHTPLTDEQRECLTTVKESADHLLGMVNDLLDLSKIEAGQLHMETIAFDLGALLDSVRRLLVPLAASKNLALRLDEPEAAPPAVLVGDPARLRQILLNLGANAIKFTDAGEVRITVVLAPVDDPARVRLEVDVADTGVGIPEAALDSIFEPFSQADNSIARRYGGSGLGLAICRQLLALMGGSLEVESAVGRGSVFRVRCEFFRGDPDVLASQPRQELTLPPMALLVVDDNPTNLMVASRLLSRLGQTPDEALGGREALGRLSGRRYDAVLLDIEMPELDGFAVARRIRAGEAGPENRDVAIIALTAHSQQTFRQQCLDAGMQEFVAKPIEAERLHAVLAALFSRRADTAAPGTPEEERVLDTRAALDRLDGDWELYRGVCQDFADKYDPDRETAALTLANREGLCRVAHTLKGLARTIGANRVSRVAESLEQALHNGDMAAAATGQSELEAELRRVMPVIRAMLASPGAPEGPRVA